MFTWTTGIFAATENDKFLIEAAKSGDQKTVEELIRLGVNINYEDPNGFTAISYAVSKNQIETVKQLLKVGAKLDFEKGELTPLMIAAKSANIHLVRILIEAGADVNAEAASQHGEPYTPLLAAVTADNPDPEVVRVLVQSGGTKNKLALLNAVSHAKERKLDQIEELLEEAAGKADVLILSYHWRSITGIQIGLLIAFLGLIIWPAARRSKRMNTNQTHSIKKIFQIQLILQILFVVVITGVRLLNGWSFSAPLFGTIVVSYYFAAVGSLGIILSLVVSLSHDGTAHSERFQEAR